MLRERLPDRRSTWTQKATIAEKNEKPQTFYLSFGEYEDGRLGEIWVEAQKENTFARGVLAALARTVSIALQYGVPVEAIVASLRGLDFSPRGQVSRTPTTDHATSICDWVAQEIQAAYVKPSKPADPPPAPESPTEE